MKRWALRPLEGTVLITLKAKFAFTDNILESRLIDIVEDETGTEIEYIDTKSGGDAPLILFRIHTVEFEEVMPVVIMLSKVLSAWMKTEDLQFDLVKK